MRLTDFRAVISLALPLAATLVLAQSRDNWKHAVSAADRARSNPLAAQPKAIEAGANLYSQYCSRCHGDNAEGRGKKPSLRGPDTANSTDGELFWILKNGDLAHGMPDWSQLPEPERWQLVAYLRSLQIPASPAAASPNPATPAP
jgi:mono/diheme cytochrome c family protein